MDRNRTPLYIALGIVAALIGAWLAHETLQIAPRPLALQSGTVLEPARALPTFALIDQDGQPFTLDRLRGHWSLLFFGFTRCGDICPTTLALLAAVETRIPPQVAERPQVVFISVDGRRDTPVSVKAYVRNFSAGFVGVTGKQLELDALTAALGVPSAIRELDNGQISVDHSGAILAIDPSARFRSLFSPPHSVDALTGDYLRLIGKAE